MKKVKLLTLSLSFIASAFVLSACVGNGGFGSYDDQSQEINAGLPSSIVVCRSKQCAPATANMSKEFLYNAYYSLMESNVGSNILVCAADSVSHVCYEPFFSFEINAGITPATVAIDAVRIIDIGIKKDGGSIVPVLDYSIYTNGVRARCAPSSAFVNVKSPSYMVIDSTQTACQFTATGSSSMSIVLTVDYIDLDYGIIGAYYSAGVSGSAFGGGKGYLLLRFEKPVNPDIYCQQKKASCAPFRPNLPKYDCCGGYGKGKMPSSCNGKPCDFVPNAGENGLADSFLGIFSLSESDREKNSISRPRNYEVDLLADQHSRSRSNLGRKINYNHMEEDYSAEVYIAPVPEKNTRQPDDD